MHKIEIILLNGFLSTGKDTLVKLFASYLPALIDSDEEALVKMIHEKHPKEDKHAIWDYLDGMKTSISIESISSYAYLAQPLKLLGFDIHTMEKTARSRKLIKTVLDASWDYNQGSLQSLVKHVSNLTIQKNNTERRFTSSVVFFHVREKERIEDIKEFFEDHWKDDYQYPNVEVEVHTMYLDRNIDKVFMEETLKKQATKSDFDALNSKFSFKYDFNVTLPDLAEEEFKTGNLKSPEYIEVLKELSYFFILNGAKGVLE